MPNHNHTMMASMEEGDRRTPASNRSLAESLGGSIYQSNTSANLVPMDERSLPEAGGSQAHNNLQPFLTLNFIIALVGLYPSRS